MALVGRRPGRHRRRWIVLGVVLTVVVLGVDAAVSSRSDAPARQQATLAYLDTVRPLVERSTQEGTDLADVRANAISLGRDGIGRRLDRVSRDADGVLSESRKLDPPSTLREANELLLATFAIRSKAAGTMRQALSDALGTQPPEPAVDALAEAAKDMVAADRAYELFLSSLPSPSAGTPPGASKWETDDQSWDRAVLTSFVGALRSSQVLSPVHDLAVALVLVEPAVVGNENGAGVLPLARNLRLQIVVTNTGNETEKHMTVDATITPAAIGPTDTARDFVDLAPGQRRTVVLGTLRPVLNTPFSLTVRIEPAGGETNVSDNEKVLTFVMH
jgi:hypothetical protein